MEKNMEHELETNWYNMWGFICGGLYEGVM